MQRVQPEPKGIKVIPARQGHKVQQGLLVPREQLAQPDPLDKLDQQDLRVQQDQLELRVLQVLQGRQEQQVPQELRVQKAIKVTKETLVPMDQLGQLAPQAQDGLGRPADDVVDRALLGAVPACPVS